jgi:hypothetical protein
MATIHQADGPPRLRRALYAFPILGLGLLMVRAFSMAGPTVPVVAEFVETGRFELDGVRVPILKTFYGISWLDELYAGISASFVLLQSMVDPGMYWQTLMLLTEFVGVYAIMLFESGRPVNKSSLFQFPVISGFVAQLAGGGFIINLHHYFYHIFRPIQRSKNAPGQWKLDGAVCIAVLPSMVLGYYVPHFLGYFHQSLEGRHWWSWIWQLFPIWVGILVTVVSKAVRLNSAFSSWLDAPGRALVIAKNTGYVIAFVNGAVNYAALLASDVPIRDMFLPRHLFTNPETFHDILRAILQYDYICCFGGFAVWLICSFTDVKAAGLCDYSWATLGLMAVVAVPLLGGFGNFFIIAWLVREDMTSAWANAGTSSKQE